MLQPRLAAPLTVVALLMIGCVDGTLPRAASPSDPSNPAAPEAPFSPPPPLFGSTPPPVTTAPAPAGEVVYTCPMHPQIAQNAPGKCPICGMTLVPRSGAAPAPEHTNHADHGGAK